LGVDRNVGVAAGVGSTVSAQVFAVTYDYRCPFARNAHEHVVAGLRAGAHWEVEFLPFSLTQSHVEEGDSPVWDDPGKAPDLLAIETSLVVRDQYPASFLDFHLAMFRARHDRALDLRDEAVVRAVLTEVGLDAHQITGEVAEGWPRQLFRKAHEAAVSDHHVFGVPTFIAGDAAVFVRIMTRAGRDLASSLVTIEHILSLISDHPEINEFKHTSIAR
jgi:hypothetical protein